MLYATRFRAPDAFAFVETQGRKAILISDLELDRARREAQVETVVSYSEAGEKSAGQAKAKTCLLKSAGGIPKKPKRSAGS